ncbi:MAG TPA: T9SS type A sorting domain-containing protein, partial [Chitinophagales bacterium]|nr:T9SS type A sorting domain-containing protein [Chitinophagales bacterium]
VEYTDTLHYLMPGEPDTLRLIFFGGRNDDPAKVGNTTWLDDVAFYYETTGLVPLDADDAVSVYPNPANNILHLKSSEALAGSQFNIIDVTGKVLISQSIENANVDFYIGNLAAGSYFYSVQPKTTHNPFTGMFSITR